jgi:glycerol transport system ATP-binding protein
VELFERPRHTFVGHFIGSPGMNVLPCRIENGRPVVGDRPVAVQNPPSATLDGRRLEIGVRPEFASLGADGLPVAIAKVSDAGRYRIVEARLGEHRIHVLTAPDLAVPAGGAHVRFDPAHTRLYADGWLVE